MCVLEDAAFQMRSILKTENLLLEKPVFSFKSLLLFRREAERENCRIALSKVYPFTLLLFVTNIVVVVVIRFSLRRPPSASAVRNHGRTHPTPCVRPRRVCSVFGCTCTVLPF